jgi:hypothetical protein
LRGERDRAAQEIRIGRAGHKGNCRRGSRDRFSISQVRRAERADSRVRILRGGVGGRRG